MCETFKWIKLLVVTSPKDALQIPGNISLAQMIVSDARAFQSTLKNANIFHPHQISYLVEIDTVSKCVLTLFTVKGRF